MSLLDPRVWLAGIVWSILLAIAGYMTGYESASDKAERVQLENAVNANRAINAMNDWRLVQGDELRRANNTRFDAYRQEKAHAELETSRLLAGLRADNRRLRLPASACAASQKPDGGTVAPGHSAEGYAELDQATTDALFDIARRGDDAIRKHAVVVDAYEALRQACTAPIPLTNPTEQP